jgi:hypothetical protein
MAEEEPKKAAGKSKVEKMQPQVFAEDMSEEWSKDAITAGTSFAPLPCLYITSHYSMHDFQSLLS